MTIEISNDSGRTAETDALVDLARFVLAQLRIHPDAELSIVLVDRPTMTSLNEKWMGEVGPTDVLSFPMDELRPPEPGAAPPRGMLGDVVLCPEVAEVQGERAGHGTDAELELLCVHGVLHLLGFDHAEPDEERAMFALQSDLLDKWRASRPATRSTG